MNQSLNAAIEALKQGDRNTIRDLLEANPNLASDKTEQGLSLLMMAAYYRQQAIIDLCLQHRRNLNLHEAAAIGNLPQVSRHLMKHPEDIDSFAADGFTPLGLACFFGHTALAEYLITQGATVDLAANNSFKVRPLHSAVASNQIEIVRLLLTHDADPNAAQMQGVRPLHSAAHNGFLEVLDLLLAHQADKDVQTDDGKTPLDMAVEAGFEEVVKRLS